MDNPIDNRPDTAEDVYRRRSAQHGADERRLADRSRTLSYARVFTFLAGLACAVGAVFSMELLRLPLFVAAAALFVAFVALVVHHSGVEARQRHHEVFRTLNDLALARVHRDWKKLPGITADVSASHAYAEDLDLFGRASLSALVWGGGTEPGRARLSEWLLNAAAPDAVRARQQAVAELAPLLDLRQNVQASAAAGSLHAHDVERFLEWCEGPQWLSRHGFAVFAMRALTGAIVVLVVLHAAGVIDTPYWLLPVIVAFIVSNLFALKVEHLFDRAFSHHAVFRYYADLFRLVCAARLNSPLLTRLQSELEIDHLTADREIASLNRLMQLADLRRSALVHLPVQIFTLWDFHVVLLVERWQRRAGHTARQWFEALATFEALAALSSLRFDNPSWAFPVVDEQRETLEANDLGHPLLPDDVRVGNDVTLGPPGKFLLVTGSNMSGKSTLLRAIGVNAVLAQAGAPVCAARLLMPPVRLRTSIRVQDSLEEGVSFFLAAVKRLKQVVEAADSDTSGGAPILLYLLDEVLRGTNTAERQIAVRSILRHLLARRAIGAVTTHDLALAASGDLASASHAVHFTEHLDEPRHGAMTFDYRLRPGLATSRNALKLMQMVGLEVPEQ